jgi:hypothetical protein
MKTLLLAAVLVAPAVARANPQALDQLQTCAAGGCWDTKGQPVTTVPPGGVVFREPSRVQSPWSKKPAEPPRYTVMTKEEVQAIRHRQEVVGTVLSVGMGALIGANIGGFIGGPFGIVAGVVLGAAIGYAAFRLLRH